MKKKKIQIFDPIIVINKIEYINSMMIENEDFMKQNNIVNKGKYFYISSYSAV